MEREEVVELIRSYVTELVGQQKLEIHDDVPFERYGLDSTAAAGLSGELSERLNIELKANAAFENPTVEAMADYVMSLLEETEEAI
jgi:acyl carrier protein